MNKAPGPPSSSPLPAPSPNLPQPNFASTPPPPMVFATPTPPPPMTTTAPRQPFYASRPALPSNSARVLPSSAPRSIPPPHGTHPPHVFQPGSQVMMIPQQPISFPSSQGPAYYIHGQYPRPSYVPPQQYQVAGSPSFYPGTSPVEYAGAYYSAQPQFTPPVAATPVIVNPAPQQQQTPPPLQHTAVTKRERKQVKIRIRDPNQGGRDITEEIMSGGRSAFTPPPLQSALSASEGEAISQSNGDNVVATKVGKERPDEWVKPVVSLEFPIPPGESPVPDDALPSSPPTSPISDSVEFPPAVGEEVLPKDTINQGSWSTNIIDLASIKENGAGPVAVSVSVLASGAEPTLESPIAQPEELQLVNGLTADANRDVSPLAEPDLTQEALPITDKSLNHTVKAIIVKETAVQAIEKDLPAVEDALASVVTEIPDVLATTPVGKNAPALASKETPVIVSKEVLVLATKEKPAPVVKNAPIHVAKEAPAPIFENLPTPITKEIPIPVVKNAPASVAKKTPKPDTKDIPATVIENAPSSVAKKTPKPDTKAIPATIIENAPSSVAKKTPEPDTKDIPAIPKDIPVRNAPVPVAEEVTAPVVKNTPPSVAKKTPEPDTKDIPATVIENAPAHVAKEAPVPVTNAPVPIAEEVTAPVVKNAPPSVAKKTPEPDTKDIPAVVIENAPVAKEIPISVTKKTPALIAVQTPVVKEIPPQTIRPVNEAVIMPVAIENPELTVKEIPVGCKATPPPAEEQEDTPPPKPMAPEATMQAVSMPKKKRKMKELNKKETGDILDAFKETTPPQPETTPSVKPEPAAVATLSVEEVDETWEDKLDAENIHPQNPTSATPSEQKYQYKQEQWKPLNLEEKKKYDRAFLLGFQFISASMHKPEGLPHICDVILDKVNKTALRPLDMSRLNPGPDFTPSFANLGRPSAGGRGLAPLMMGPRRSAQSGGRKEPRKIVVSGVSLTDDVQLSKTENAWKRGVRGESDDQEAAKTRELLRRVRGILNKLTPQMFQQLMKQVTELTIDTEERLKGVIDLIFEKAISEPNFSVAYANMCRCLMGLKVPTTDKPTVTVNFRKLLLNRCQKEFEKDKDDDVTFEKKQKELDASREEDVRQRLKDELEEAKNAARRRSLGNIKFIGELFKLKMLTENIMHDCVVKLLKNHDLESLECLCRLLSTIGKDLDFEKARPRMDQYFNQMEKIVKERKTSSRIRFMLQDVIDLRQNNWIPRRGDQGPKTIEQIHKEAELEEQREQIKVQQQLLSRKESRGGGGGAGGGVTLGPRGGNPAMHRGAPQLDDGWNTVPISTKNRPIDTSRLSKITKSGAMDFNNQLLAPGGKGSWGSWGKGSSGGSGAKPPDNAQDPGRPSTLNRFSALQQPSSSSSVDTDRRVPHRNSSSRDRGDRMERGPDRNRPAASKRSFSREKDEWEQKPSEVVRRVSSMSDEHLREQDREIVKRESVPTPPPATSKPALSPAELEKKSTAIIEEYLYINDLKEALLCVREMHSTSLSVFVRIGFESTLERSTIAREHMGFLLHQLIKAGILSAPEYYTGLTEVLEVAEDMAIDVPHIWVYLAELIVPMLHDGGLPMGLLFREVAKPLVPIGKAGDLLVHILDLLCKGMSHKKVGAMWKEAGLNWKDFLLKDEDMNKFVKEKVVEYTLGEGAVKPESSGKVLTPDELLKQLDCLLREKADNQRIFDWLEANLDERQTSSPAFVRTLMTSVCQAAIIYDNPYKVDCKEISQRAKLLQRYIKDEQMELQALYALQSLMVQLEQPPNLLRMFFDALYDEDVIKEEGFYKWESSKDPAEQLGKGVALKSVTAFFTWLREPEEESDNS